MSKLFKLDYESLYKEIERVAIKAFGQHERIEVFDDLEYEDSNVEKAFEVMHIAAYDSDKEDAKPVCGFSLKKVHAQYDDRLDCLFFYYDIDYTFGRDDAHALLFKVAEAYNKRGSYQRGGGDLS